MIDSMDGETVLVTFINLVPPSFGGGPSVAFFVRLPDDYFEPPPAAGPETLSEAALVRPKDRGPHAAFLAIPKDRRPEALAACNEYEGRLGVELHKTRSANVYDELLERAAWWVGALRQRLTDDVRPPSKEVKSTW